jgi:hypothetical protein
MWENRYKCYIQVDICFVRSTNAPTRSDDHGERLLEEIFKSYPLADNEKVCVVGGIR